MAQYLCDLYLWEAVLNEHPEMGAIIEIGTWTGGMSLWLHAQAEAREMLFRTYDVIKPERRIPNFVQIDVFAAAEDIGRHIEKHTKPLILFCDGGNKPREVKTFWRYMPKGSILMVHDWGTETLPSDIPEELEMVYGDFCEELVSMTRCFKVKEIIHEDKSQQGPVRSRKLARPDVSY